MKRRRDELIRTTPTNQEIRRAEKVLSRYFQLPQIIEIGESTLGQSMTPTYEYREVNANLAPSSKTESEVFKRLELEENKRQLVLLNKLRDTLSPDLVQLWDVRYEPRNMHNCETAMIQLRIGYRNKYFALKYQLIGIILDAFLLWEE